VDNISFLFYKDKVTGRVLSDTGKSIGYAPGCVFDGKMAYRDCELATLHYKGKYLGGASEYLFAYYKGRQIGVLVGAKTRHYNKDKGMSIARVVVHPSYRGCGVGKGIIQEFLRHHTANPVETTAAMARFNPVFERAGMKRVKDTEIKPPANIRKAFPKITNTTWCSRESCEELFSAQAQRTTLSRFAETLSSMYDKGGMREVYKKKNNTPMPQVEITSMTKKAILEDANVAARLFWRVRPHTMARYIKETA
jgi:GNAT superfamily N-acetyltransferase